MVDMRCMRGRERSHGGRSDPRGVRIVDSGTLRSWPPVAKNNGNTCNNRHSKKNPDLKPK